MSQILEIGSQDITFVEVLKLKGKDVKITIKSDSYKFQCYARIEVWHDYKWNLVHQIHYSNMITQEKLLYYPNKQGHDRKHFLTDRERLLTFAKELL